jgi:hypothetical protein
MMEAISIGDSLMPTLVGFVLVVTLLGVLVAVLPLVGTVLLVVVSIVVSILLPSAVWYVFGPEVGLISFGVEALLVAIIFGYMRHSKNAISKWDTGHSSK